MTYQPRIIKPREIINVVPGVVPGVVGEANIADNAVTSPKIKDDTIRTEDIGAGQVQESDIRENAVTTEKIAPGAVTPAKLSFTPATRPLTPPVTNAELGDGSVTTEKITPQSVTREKLDLAVIESFGSKIVMQPPMWIREPATYENAVPWTELPLATHLPEGTFAVIIQLEISLPAHRNILGQAGLPAQEVPGWQAGNPEMLSAVHIAMNIRKDESQESGLSVGYQSGTSGTVNFAQGIVPVTAARTIEWELQGDFISPPTKKVTVAIKLVGFII